MLFSGWEGLLRTLVVGVLAYVSLVVFLRMETDGSFSVVRRGDGNGRPSLAGVQGPRPNSESAEPITR